jgi:uncharacterized phage protein (TIGR01671 family)
LREIKIRYWSYHHRIMEYPTLININCKSGSVYSVTPIPDPQERFKDGMVPHYPRDGVLMQYTGLKDKNGVEIYEGDIVEHKYKSSNGDIKTKIYIIIYHLGCFYCAEHKGNFSSSVGYYTTLVNGNGLEIIGNIYENPELLEGLN